MGDWPCSDVSLHQAALQKGFMATRIPFSGVDMPKNEAAKCSSCGGTTRFALSVDFRVGGNGGQDLKVFPEFPKNNENILPLDIFICPNCGKIELQAPKEIKDTLLRLAK